MESLRPADFGMAFKRLNAPQQDRAEDLRHGPDGKQIVRARLSPSAGRTVPATGADQHMKVRMPVEGTAPGVKHGQKAALHAPVVFLEQFESLRRPAEQLRRENLVVELEHFMKLLRHCEHHVEMRTIRQSPANLLRPLRLPRPEAVRAVTVPTRTGIPFPVPAVAAAGLVVSQSPLPAAGDQVEGGILLITQSPGPEIAPLAQNIVDGRFDAV